MAEIYKDPSYSPEARAKDLLSRMTVEEKIGQMCQVDGRDKGEEWVKERHIGSFLHVIGEEAERLQKIAGGTRLGIPLIFGIDAIHGHAFYDGATVFPSQLGLACSWNPELIKEMAKVTAKEVILTGLHWTFSPVLCIGRDSRWGRVDETFGEDPYLIGVLASAMIKGYQGEDLGDPYSILACAKHFVAYGETIGGRDSTESEVSERKLRTVFLPPFKAAADAGCTTFMAGYHANDGTPSSANGWLLKDVLKGEWGFKGFVVTDWDNVGHLHRKQFVAPTMKDASEIAMLAGNDMMMQTLEFYENAVQLAKEGRVPEEVIDEACRRVLEIKFRLGLFDGKRHVDASGAGEIIGCKEHKALAYRSALESMVLLKNEGNTLPLSRKIKKIAVIGPNADDPGAQFGDWSFGSREHPHLPTLEYHKEYNTGSIVTLLQGIRNFAEKDIEVVYERGCDIIDSDASGIPAAVRAANESDAVVAVIGDNVLLNGETRDRADLHLTGGQQELLEALKRTGKPLVVVLINGKPLTIPWVKKNADAILEAWNPGVEGGNAAAAILFGEHNPGGKLTISFPQHVGQQPVYYNQLPGWHGGDYADMSHDPLFAFGLGLSYTSYAYSDLSLSHREIGRDGELTVSVVLENTGKRKGTEIVQLYVNDVYSSVTTPVKELKGFSRVTLEPGEKKRVELKLPVDSLALIDRQCRRVVEPGEFEVMVGSSSIDRDLLKAVFKVI